MQGEQYCREKSKGGKRMFCPKCGSKLDYFDNFCTYCGAKLNQEDFPEQMQGQKSAEEPVRRPTQMRKIAVNGYAQPAAPVEREEPRPVMTAEETYEDTGEYDYRSLPTKKDTGIRSFYIFDFLLRMLQKQNIPVLIYLLVNALIIGVVFTAVLTLPFGWGMLSGLIVYVASIIVALSPIGEFFLRQQNGCRKVTDKADVDRLEPLFREVYYRAKKANPGISSDVRLFINDDEAPNAFATGRKTMCVTRGLLNYSDEEIKATLGHEFGHLAHRDTDRILVVAIGNTIISFIFLMIQIGILIMNVIMSIVSIFSEDGFVISIFNALATFLSIFVLRGFMKLWTAFGVALCMKTSRENEYQADAFSFYLGYGYDLCNLLNSFGDVKARGLFANLASSHPKNSDRIARLMNLQSAGYQA